MPRMMTTNYMLDGPLISDCMTARLLAVANMHGEYVTAQIKNKLYMSAYKSSKVSLCIHPYMTLT